MENKTEKPKIEEKTQKNINDDGKTPDIENGGANVFARSGQVTRSPVSSLVPIATTSTTTPQEEQQGQQQQQQQLNMWPKVPKLARVEAAKKLVDELHDFVDKKNNVHKEVKQLVIKIQGALGLAAREWRSVVQRAETAEKELVAVKTSLAAASTTTPKKVKNNAGRAVISEAIGTLQRVETTPYFTPKRPRPSPDDPRPGGSKKHKDAPATGPSTTNEEVTEEATDEGTEEDGQNPWRRVGKQKNRQNRPRKRKFVKGRNRGEALLVKASGDAYEEVLRNMRNNPELKELGEDVRIIRRTRNGEMLIELKKDQKSSSSSYKEITERAMGNAVEVRALCPEATLQCKDLDEVTSEEEVRLAMKEQCELGEVQLTIRMRKGPFGTQVASIKLPIEAANKALKTGKIKVGWSVCPLSVSQTPEICFKCQEFGHIARNCKGPDRSKLCRRCGEAGHKAQDCRKPPECMICVNKEARNHVTGGPRCPAYKEAAATKSQWR